LGGTAKFVTKIISEKAAKSVAFPFYEMLLNILHVSGLDFVKHDASSLQIVIFATVFDQDLQDFQNSVISLENINRKS
jgi:hypothetical protein